MTVNRNYQNLQENYLFATIAEKVEAYGKANPKADLIRLGIGDVTLPLCPAVVEAMGKAVAEMGKKESFRGYRSDEGYEFLREAVRGYYGQRGVRLELDEIFISDGAKSDTANILDIFGGDNTVLIPDPVYPVYEDSNVMAGSRILHVDANRDNGYLPLPDPAMQADLIYICSPNNPTGAVMDRPLLQKWVDYAVANGAVILFDAAYEAYIQDPALPRSIYEIPGAERCAIEFCSLSKTAGFTGVRCGYTIVPSALEAEGRKVQELWRRRQATMFNGVSYMVQRGAEAVFSPAGQAQTRESVAYYMENARNIAATLRELGIWFAGGDNSPYIWLQCPGGMTSWEFFDHLLEKAGVVGTPGSGFGKNGEGFFRLTAFGDRQRTLEAMERVAKLLQ